MERQENVKRLPEWIKVRIPSGGRFAKTSGILDGLGLDTVCREARCPNRAECYARGTAAFLLMGPVCTRNCGFCSVKSGIPLPLDPGEPARAAQAVAQMKIAHAVFTSVTRDDVAGGGADHFARTVERTRQAAPSATVEVLVPDFRGDMHAVETVADSRPDVFNHNVETVPSLYGKVRPRADYRGSLAVLEKAAKAGGMIVKSGIMLGLGESDDEVEAVLRDLAGAGCTSVTIGQYLKPAQGRLDVARYALPEEFVEWRGKAERIGFKFVASGPFVRSSYRAGKFI